MGRNHATIVSGDELEGVLVKWEVKGEDGRKQNSTLGLTGHQHMLRPENDNLEVATIPHINALHTPNTPQAPHDLGGFWSTTGLNQRPSKNQRHMKMKIGACHNCRVLPHQRSTCVEDMEVVRRICEREGERERERGERQTKEQGVMEQ